MAVTLEMEMKVEILEIDTHQAIHKRKRKTMKQKEWGKDDDLARVIA